MGAGTKMAGSMPAKKEIDTSTYRGRFAARLYELRAGRDVKKILDALAKADIKIGKAGYYHWESGFSEPPFNALPILAKCFGVTVPDLFPKK